MSQQELVDMGKSGGHLKGFMKIRDEDSRSSSAIKSKVLHGDTKAFTRLQEIHNKRRDEARFRHEQKLQQPGQAIRNKRETANAGNHRRLFGEQTPKVSKTRRNYFTVQKALTAEEEK